MKQTSLVDAHVLAGAKLIDFAGWQMPRDYKGTGVAAEVGACRGGAGLFDVSHMGEIRATGPEALKFVQYVTTNDVSRLVPGKAQYSLLLNASGGVQDDILVYMLAPDDYLLVVNAGRHDKDWAFLCVQARAFKTRIDDESERTSLIAVQGPAAVDLVARVFGPSARDLKRFHFLEGTIASVRCRISRTGYTGEDGFEVFADWNDAPTIWDTLAHEGAAPCGLAARDILRMEAAYPLYGHELTESRNPIVSGLQWAIKTAKPDFVGRDAIVRAAQDGIRERLVGIGIVAQVQAIPRESCMLYFEGLEEPIGRVTSGTLSPTLGRGIALAIVGAGFSEPDTKLTMDIRGRRVPCQVEKLPFYKNAV